MVENCRKSGFDVRRACENACNEIGDASDGRLDSCPSYSQSALAVFRITFSKQKVAPGETLSANLEILIDATRNIWRMMSGNT
eukprot:2696801-Karenia_brevis.AAC.1